MGLLRNIFRCLCFEAPPEESLASPLLGPSDLTSTALPLSTGEITISRDGLAYVTVQGAVALSKGVDTVVDSAQIDNLVQETAPAVTTAEANLEATSCHSTTCTLLAVPALEQGPAMLPPGPSQGELTDPVEPQALLVDMVTPVLDCITHIASSGAPPAELVAEPFAEPVVEVVDEPVEESIPETSAPPAESSVEYESVVASTPSQAELMDPVEPDVQIAVTADPVLDLASLIAPSEPTLQEPELVAEQVVEPVAMLVKEASPVKSIPSPMIVSESTDPVLLEPPAAYSAPIPIPVRTADTTAQIAESAASSVNSVLQSGATETPSGSVTTPLEEDEMASTSTSDASKRKKKKRPTKKGKK